ncbi:LysR substrate-binding domain-containing protein [Litoribrevibacter euphylliae]|uniref:LysR substrate-binding domain-containing protein n=1 Tax=Litoribrevibacter euphylliae TaxID=1834034 RepID=A0ABV7HH44_9GAMM
MKCRSDDLELLLAVVDCGGFSAAADSLGIQVARVSRAVNKVEKQLSVTLLNRTTRRIELTAEGRTFVDNVRLGLQQIQQAEDDVINRGALPEGRLRVDAASPFIFHQLIPLIESFKAMYPAIELELSSNEVFVDLIEKKTDLAIRIGKLEDSTLHARALGRSPLYVVASPAYLAKRGLPDSPQALNQHDIIGFSGQESLNKWPLKAIESLTPTLAATNGESIRQLTLAGNGIACLSNFMIQQDLEEGRLVSVLDDFRIGNTDRELINAVYYKTSSVARRISAFIDFIQPRLTL